MDRILKILVDLVKGGLEIAHRDRIVRGPFVDIGAVVLELLERGGGIDGDLLSTDELQVFDLVILDERRDLGSSCCCNNAGYCRNADVDPDIANKQARY